MSKETKELNVDENVETMPIWLNADFFKEVLRTSENTKNVEISNFKVTPASAKHEHYCSVLFRASVEYHLEDKKPKQQTMIIKAEVEEEGEQKDLFKESTIFETEIEMYAVVVPKFEEVLSSAGDATKFGPRMLYYNLKPRKVIVFEDLVALGYEVIKDRGTNYEETKAVYEKIAKWHAISFKLQLENPDFFKNFQRSNLSSLNIKENPAFTDGFVNFIELLDSQQDLKQYKAFFEPLVGKVVDYWQAAVDEFQINRQTDAYYVLCHGDFHHKNMMFKNNSEHEGVPDVLLLDFQQCYLGPIVNDIINSIYMIIDEEQRIKNLDELQGFYFETFKSTLEKVNFKGSLPTFSDYRKQMLRHKGFELCCFTTFAPMIMAIDDGTYNVGELMTDAEKRKEVYKNPNYIRQVHQLLPKYTTFALFSKLTGHQNP